MRQSAGIAFTLLTAFGIMSPMMPVRAQDTPPEGQIVFVKEQNNQYSLMVGDVNDLDNAAALTQSATGVLAPSVSPQGDLIAYVDSTDFSLRIITPDGSPGTKNIAGGINNDLPNTTGWLPDGSGVLFGSDRRNKYVDFDVKTTGPRTSRKEIFVAPVNGGAPYLLGEIPLTVDWFGNWSPDGKWLLVSGSPAPTLDGDNLVYERNTYLASVDGELQKLTSTPTYAASFSPDGTKIAMVDVRGNFNLYDIDLSQPVIALGNSTPIYLGSGLTLSSVAWSPGGSRLAVSVFDGRAGSTGGPGFVYFINPDGSDIVRAISTGEANFSLAWLPPEGAVTAVPVAATTAATAAASSEAPAVVTVESPVATVEVAPAATVDAALDLGCTILANGVANLRQGPGTTFSRVGTMSAGQMSTVSGQATGKDSFVWWQLEEGGWVRSDLVQTATDCSTVPVVTP